MAELHTKELPELPWRRTGHGGDLRCGGILNHRRRAKSFERNRTQLCADVAPRKPPHPAGRGPDEARTLQPTRCRPRISQGVKPSSEDLTRILVRIDFRERTAHFQTLPGQGRSNKLNTPHVTVVAVSRLDFGTGGKIFFFSLFLSHQHAKQRHPSMLKSRCGRARQEVAGGGGEGLATGHV